MYSKWRLDSLAVKDDQLETCVNSQKRCMNAMLASWNKTVQSAPNRYDNFMTFEWLPELPQLPDSGDIECMKDGAPKTELQFFKTGQKLPQWLEGTPLGKLYKKSTSIYSWTLEEMINFGEISLTPVSGADSRVWHFRLCDENLISKDGSILAWHKKTFAWISESKDKDFIPLSNELEEIAEMRMLNRSKVIKMSQLLDLPNYCLGIEKLKQHELDNCQYSKSYVDAGDAIYNIDFYNGK